MKRLALCGLWLLAACAPSPQSIQTAIAETQASWTATPAPTLTLASALTAEPPPTYTPSTEPPKATETAKPTLTKATATASDPKSGLASAIQGVIFGKVRAVSFAQYEDGDILVEWSIDDALTESSTKFGAREDAANILKTISQSGINFTSVVIEGYFPMQDVYGNIKDTQVIDLVYLRPTVDKINWSNFLSENIYKIADHSERGSPIVSYVHPVFLAP